MGSYGYSRPLLHRKYADQADQKDTDSDDQNHSAYTLTFGQSAILLAHFRGYSKLQWIGP